MKESIYKITENCQIADKTFGMELSGDSAAVSRPGQFINILLPGSFLRRPFSVCDYGEGWIRIIYKIVGKGTEKMSHLQKGDELSVISGLGNGFDLSRIPESCALIGGGAGVAPLYGLCKRLLLEGKKPAAVLGFNNAGEVFLEKEFRNLNIPVTVATVDGSFGQKGFATDFFEEGGYAVCCGPEAMMRVLYKKSGDGMFSLEARMGCGFGACMGCSLETRQGFRRICKEGPVFQKEDLLW